MILKPKALEVYKDPTRFRVLSAGRRFGKTTLAIVELLNAAGKIKQTCWYVAPTYRQAKQIAWDKLKELTPPTWIKGKPNETDLTIVLRSHSKISLRGADNPDSLRGPGLNFLVIDETAFVKECVWEEVLRPMLSDTLGRALFIGTPDGFNHFHNLFLKGQNKQDLAWKSWQFTTMEGGWIDQNEIEQAKRDMDEITFRQEYEASFEKVTGSVYYNFSDENIKPCPEHLRNGNNLKAGIDFNVEPFITASIFAVENDIAWFFDDISIPRGNTYMLVDELKNRYGNRLTDVYPDPAGRAASTSAKVGTTDHAILKQAGYRVHSRPSTLSVKNGINAVNSRICSMKKERRLFVDPSLITKNPRIPRLIDCFRKHCYKPGSSIPEEDIYKHLLDGVRYAVEYLWPIKTFEVRYQNA